MGTRAPRGRGNFHSPEFGPRVPQFPTECQLCQDGLAGTDVWQTPCNHYQHMHCVNRWLERFDRDGLRPRNARGEPIFGRLQTLAAIGCTDCGLAGAYVGFRMETPEEAQQAAEAEQARRRAAVRDRQILEEGARQVRERAPSVPVAEEPEEGDASDNSEVSQFLRYADEAAAAMPESNCAEMVAFCGRTVAQRAWTEPPVKFASTARLVFYEFDTVFRPARDGVRDERDELTHDVELAHLLSHPQSVIAKLTIAAFFVAVAMTLAETAPANSPMRAEFGAVVAGWRQLRPPGYSLNTPPAATGLSTAEVALGHLALQIIDSSPMDRGEIMQQQIAAAA